jgi:hypothetical protein
MSAITNIIAGIGGADVVITNEGGALGNSNTAAQLAAASASLTASVFGGANPFANAAAITLRLR